MKVEELSAGRIGTLHPWVVAGHRDAGALLIRYLERAMRRFLDGRETGLCLDTGRFMVGGSVPAEIAELATDRDDVRKRPASIREQLGNVQEGNKA